MTAELYALHSAGLKVVEAVTLLERLDALGGLQAGCGDDDREAAA